MNFKNIYQKKNRREQGKQKTTKGKRREEKKPNPVTPFYFNVYNFLYYKRFE